MIYELTDEQTMLTDSLRAFLDEEVHPYEDEADRAGEVSVERCERIKQGAIEMAFYAANLPESVGGGGLDYTTLGLIERELGKVSYALGGNIARPTELLLACDGDQVQKYLEPCVSGEKHECFALAELGIPRRQARRRTHDSAGPMSWRDRRTPSPCHLTRTRRERGGRWGSGGDSLPVVDPYPSGSSPTSAEGPRPRCRTRPASCGGRPQ